MKLKEITKDLDVIFLCKFGSHLYGTNTENSDEDYKGVFLATIEQCILNDIPKSFSYSSGKDDSKNDKEDIDIEIYSLHYYLKLLKKGDTGAIDMLHAPINNLDIVLECNRMWGYLHKNRADFYTTNLSAFVGYCRTQASKYGIKGSRLNAAKEVLKFLANRYGRLSDHELPSGDHIHVIEADEENNIPFPMYQVCGKKFQMTVQCSYAYESLKKFYDEYGNRAKLAAENKGVDWKAVSHAIRCAFEMHSIYSQGDISFPLRQADYIRMVKNGERDYKAVAENLETLMDQVESLAAHSKYPKKVDMTKWHEWLIKIYSSQYKELSD